MKQKCKFPNGFSSKITFRKETTNKKEDVANEINLQFRLTAVILVRVAELPCKKTSAEAGILPSPHPLCFIFIYSALCQIRL